MRRSPNEGMLPIRTTFVGRRLSYTYLAMVSPPHSMPQIKASGGGALQIYDCLICAGEGFHQAISQLVPRDRGAQAVQVGEILFANADGVHGAPRFQYQFKYNINKWVCQYMGHNITIE